MLVRAVPSSIEDVQTLQRELAIRDGIIEGLKQWFEDSIHNRESNFFNHVKEYHEFLQKIDQLEKSERSFYYEDNDS